MSGQDLTKPRLSRTRSGRRERRYEGLTLAEYQARELRRFLAEQWPDVRAAARDLNEPVQTIRNWHEGTSFPSGYKLLKLLHRGGLRLMARLDPEPEATLALALQHAHGLAIDAEIARLEALRAAPPAPVR